MADLKAQDGRKIDFAGAVQSQYQGANIITATTTVVKSGQGVLHSINILGGTLGDITAYDNTAGSGTILIPAFTPPTGTFGTLTFNREFDTGLTIVTGSAMILTVSYR